LLRRFTSAGSPDTTLAPDGTVSLTGLFVNVGLQPTETVAFQADGGFTVATSTNRLRRYLSTRRTRFPWGLFELLYTTGTY